MAEIGQYGEWKFEITGSTMRAFQNVQIVSECETEEKTADWQNYVAAKNGKPIQMTMAIVLSAYLGIDVREETMSLLNAAQRSYQGYFYIQSKKLFPFMLMLTRAEIREFMMSPKGQWVSCEVDITLRQSSKEWIAGTPPSSEGESFWDEDDGGGSSGSKKASAKTKGTITRTPMTGVSQKSIAAVAAARAAKSAQNTVSTAKQVSQTIKKKTQPTVNLWREASK